MLAEFGDVGLMTGDVTINPSASCLVMTTEVRIQVPTTLKFWLKILQDFKVYVISRFRSYARSRMGDI